MTVTGRMRAAYVLSDLVMSFVGFFGFDIIRYYYRNTAIDQRPLGLWLQDPNIVTGLVVFPVMMVCLYAVSGYYNSVREKSRLDSVRNSFAVGMVGMLLIYFVIMINDPLPSRINSYELLGVLWLALSLPVLAGRLTVGWRRQRRLRAGEGAYRAVIVGEPGRAATLSRRLASTRNKINRYAVEQVLSVADGPDDLVARITAIGPEAIIVTPHPDGLQATTDIINRLYPLGPSILITPDLYQLITARTRLTDVVGEPLIDITAARLSPLTTNLKRIADIVGSSLALVALSPVFAAVALAIRLDSPGPVFYRQERVGRHKRLFKINKFRTMVTDAEAGGPALSAPNDPRVTRVGRVLRKYRLDEIPQFVNVLRGEMSLVGPRPERKHFVDQIVARVPHYSLIHQVRPGITSWGMVKYGYAENVDEMVERLYYDLLYIENVSFAVDMKIIFHTLSTVISGRGV